MRATLFLLAILAMLPSGLIYAEDAVALSAQLSAVQEGTWESSLASGEQATLLAIAEDSIAWQAAGAKEPFSFNKYQLTPALKAKAAAVVVVKAGESNSNRAGTIFPKASLYETVHRNAAAAAKKAGGSDLAVEVVVVSPIKPVRSLSSFIKGQHGIWIDMTPYKPFFLSHDPVEQELSMEDMLDKICVEAGLPKGSWKRGARYRLFMTQTFRKP